MDNQAKLILKILLQDELNYKEIVISLAMEHPDIFLNLTPINRYKKMKDSGQYVAAIKAYRNETGATLVEAKEYIDSL